MFIKAKPVRFILRRGTESTLNKKNPLLEKNELICVLEDKDKLKKSKDLMDTRCRFKVGDGVHRYNDLPFEEGKIPVVIIGICEG